jgi:WD40-like Beta Propeller Repeat
MTKKLSILWLAAVIAWTMAWQLSAASQAAQTFQSVLVVKQASHLGEGAALSADGMTMVYVAADRGLHLLKVASREDHVLLKEAGGVDVFSDPSFSPDGMRVVFSASGGTMHWPSEIYSVGTDGTDVRQLTASSPKTGSDGYYSEYFYAPKYSPDGSQILISRYDHDPSSAQHESAELISPDGSRRIRVADGRPLFWSATGNAIFVARGVRDQEGKGTTVVKVDLVRGTSEPVFRLNEPIFGKLPKEDVFAVAADDSTVGFATVQAASASAPAPAPFPVRKRSDGTAGTGRPDEWRLISMHFDRSAGRVLVYYKSDVLGDAETLEIFTIQ